MGITRTGRFAAVTNYREMGREEGGGRREKETGIRFHYMSRGIMVRDYLAGKMTAAQYMDTVLADKDNYGGFNLLLMDSDSFSYCSNRAPEPIQIEPGIHGLSNHLLDTGWRKVTRGRQNMADALSKPDSNLTGNLFSILQDRSRAADNELPNTGFGVQRESILSSAFIVSPTYGTRSSTVILVDNNGQVTFTERTYGGPDDEAVERTLTFPLDSGLRITD
jgi:uncharacterized protein with NRDE domain